MNSDNYVDGLEIRIKELQAELAACKKDAPEELKLGTVRNGRLLNPFFIEGWNTCLMEMKEQP